MPPPPHSKNILCVALNNFRNSNLKCTATQTQTYVLAALSCGIRLHDATIITANFSLLFSEAQLRENSVNISTVRKCTRMQAAKGVHEIRHISKISQILDSISTDHLERLEKLVKNSTNSSEEESQHKNSSFLAETSPRHWLSCWISWNCFDDFPLSTTNRAFDI